MIVTFCGHGKEEYGFDVEKRVLEITEKLIKCGAEEFLFGGYGNFDLLCARVINKHKRKYKNIKSVLVIPYIDRKYDMSMYDESVYPALENVPLKFAITKRNEWMVINSHVVVSYVKYQWGGAAKTLSFAQKNRKQIINIIEAN